MALDVLVPSKRAPPRVVLDVDLDSTDEALEPEPAPTELARISSLLVSAEKRYNSALLEIKRVDKMFDSLYQRREAASAESGAARLCLLQVRRRMHRLIAGDEDSADVDVQDQVLEAVVVGEDGDVVEKD